jgi:hypothetical protein
MIFDLVPMERYTFHQLHLRLNYIDLPPILFLPVESFPFYKEIYNFFSIFYFYLYFYAISLSPSISEHSIS